MLAKSVEYALRAVVFLAQDETRPRTTEEIARRTFVPAAYLAKVLQSLNHHGLVHSQRGVGGGIVLARPATEVTILEVVNAVDRIARIRECPLGLAAHGVRLCPLHRRLDNALALVEEAFGATTLAEVVAEPSSSVPLCDFPAIPPDRER
jgi:Rrf2 family protein